MILPAYMAEGSLWLQDTAHSCMCVRGSVTERYNRVVYVWAFDNQVLGSGVCLSVVVRCILQLAALFRDHWYNRACT